MKLDFLGPLYAGPGPYACAYVDTSRDVEDPDRAIESRRRHLAEQLTAQGADMATVGVVGRAVGTDRDLPGRHGQAVFAAHGRMSLCAELPRPPSQDHARYTTVPDAMPLAVQHAPDLPYTVVSIARAEEHAGNSGSVLVADIQSGHWPAARVSPSHRSRWQAASGEWRQLADDLATRIAQVAAHDGTEAIVMSGDTWARNVLCGALPEPLRGRVVAIDSEGRPERTERVLLEDQLEYLFDGRRTRRDQQLVDRFLADRARGAGSCEGLADTVTALRHGQAEAVLLNDPYELDRKLWVGLGARHLALTAEELTADGIATPWPEPADAALIRAVVGTGADLVVVPHRELPLTDGLGALLRYS